MYDWSVIHGIKRKPHLSVVWNWYHFVAIAILHQPRPTDSADINTRLQLSDTISIPPMHGGFLLLAATKQLYEWYFLSVCPSVTPFWLCSHHRIIMKFSGVITTDQGKVHAKGQRSKVKVTEVTTQLNRFRTVTPVWIHIWWWNDTYSLMLLRRGALLSFKVIRQISRSHRAKIVKFDPDWAFPDYNSSLNSPMATKWCTKLEVA